MSISTSSSFSSKTVVASSIGIATCKNWSPLKSRIISFPTPMPTFPRLAFIVPSLLTAPPSNAVKPPSKVVMDPLLIIEESWDSSASIEN